MEISKKDFIKYFGGRNIITREEFENYCCQKGCQDEIEKLESALK